MTLNTIAEHKYICHSGSEMWHYRQSFRKCNYSNIFPSIANVILFWTFLYIYNHFYGK